MKPWERYRAIKAAREKGDEATFMEHWEALRQDEVGRADATLGNVLLLEAVRLAKTWKDFAPETPKKIIFLLESLRNDFQLIPEECNWYALAMRTALRVQDNYPQFLDFADWWGLEHLKEEDFTGFQTQDGRTLIPLAERIYQAVGDAILDLEPFDKERAEAFLAKLQAVSKDHPEYTWLDYVESRLLLRLGQPQDAMDIVRRFLLKKPREYWAWTTLAQAAEQSGKPDVAIACLANAVTMQRKEELLVKVRENLGRLWLAAGEAAAGRAEIDMAYRTRMRNWGKIPPSLQELMESEAYLNAPNNGDNRYRYRSLSLKARLFSVQGLPEAWGIVVAVIKQEKGTKVILATGMEVTQIYSAGMATRPLEVGDMVKLYLDPSIMKAVLLEPGEPEQYPEFVREERGRIQPNPKGFGFIGDLFIPPFMIEEIAADINRVMRVRAAWNYNRKRDAWQWQVLRVQPDK